MLLLQRFAQPGEDFAFEPAVRHRLLELARRRSGPTESQGRYGSPCALEPPSTRMRYSSGGDASKRRRQRRHPVHPAAPRRRADLQGDPARPGTPGRTAMARRLPRLALPRDSPRPRRQVCHQRRPGQRDHRQRPVPDRARPAAPLRSSPGAIRAAARDPAGQHDGERRRKGDRHRHGGQAQPVGDPPRSARRNGRRLAGRHCPGSRRIATHGSDQPGGPEDVAAREFQAGQEPRLVDVRGRDRGSRPNGSAPASSPPSPSSGRRRSSIP